MSTPATDERATQAERLLAELKRGRRLSKWDIRNELRIENVGGRIADLRRAGVPVATIWHDKATGQVAFDGAGKPRVWFGDEPGTRQSGNRCFAEYQLYCKGCRAWHPIALGWRWQIEGGWELAEFADTFLCPRCLADELASTSPTGHLSQKEIVFR